MNEIFLGLGSNLGHRLQNLEDALKRLQEVIVPQSLRISPVYETPALLPQGAEISWNTPFLNLVVQAQTDLEPLAFLRKLKSIEKELERGEGPRWSPRTIDIDILLWGDQSFEKDFLKVPHSSIRERAFVLDPLKDLAPSMKLPGDSKTVLELARAHIQHAPIWMGILNITPDSFSDGGVHRQISTIEKYFSSLEPSVGIIDIGAESTRPTASVLSWQEEWLRLHPTLELFQSKFSSKLIRPRLSIDTRHPETAAKALELGADIINDVSGLSDQRMIEVLRSSSCEFILMHSLTIPANPAVVLDTHRSTVLQLKEWFQQRLGILERAGISKDRVILDPGIGFGKNALQSLEILKQISEIMNLGSRVVVGHSRKSFMKTFSSSNASERDAETLGISLKLAERGVDILRVHEPNLHARAFLAANHIS